LALKNQSANSPPNDRPTAQISDPDAEFDIVKNVM
jgi:hypothetical protein